MNCGTEEAGFESGDKAHRPAADTSETPCPALCKHCGGLIAIRNPTGRCDHLYWPDNLTDDAKRANGFRLVTHLYYER